MPVTTSKKPSLISRTVRQQALRNTSPGVVMCGRFQRLGPNAGGGAERGSGRCLSCEVVVVRRVAGTAAGVAGSWFGVSGSWSRMRHQRAAAGWSSGRGPAAAADRTSWVASKPARVRLLNLSSSSGRNGSAVALGTSAASSCRHCRSAWVSAAASRLSSCCWKNRAALSSWGGPVGRRSPGVDLGGCPPHLHVGDQLGRNESAPDSRPGRRFTFGVAADLVGELSNQA